jgi:hypothetical protein
MKEQRDTVILASIGAVDIDPILAILYATACPVIKITGIVGTHFYTKERAKVIKLILSELGHNDIKVYAGSGIQYRETFDEDTRTDFLNKNELFPTSLFGMPIGTMKHDECQWFPKFIKAYKDEYDVDSIDIEQTAGQIFLANELRKYSSENRLLIICVGTMHDLVDIPDELIPNMELWTMGGGFETETKEDIGKCTKLNISRAGYNWGVCPGITKQVIEKFNRTNTSFHLISPNTVRNNGVAVDPQTYDKWVNLSKRLDIPKISKTIMTDWSLNMSGNKLKDHKNLCDCLTMALACHNWKYETYTVKTKKFKTSIDNIDKFSSYLESSQEFPLLCMEADDNGNSDFVYDFDAKQVLEDILVRIENVLFPNSS